MSKELISITPISVNYVNYTDNTIVSSLLTIRDNSLVVMNTKGKILDKIGLKAEVMGFMVGA